MRALIAFDKFKDALTAEEACNVAAVALLAVHPDWTVDLCPFTDGGEGFARILTRAAGGEMTPVGVSGPRGQPILAEVGFVPFSTLPAPLVHRLRLPEKPRSDTLLGIIDMASASGLALLSEAERDPWLTTTAGTGELITATHRRGCAAVLLGVGGSATNDLGLGALSMLGLEFLDCGNVAIRPPAPSTWSRIKRIIGAAPAGLPPVRIACDVTNPVLGPNGCAAMFGPQKGLRPTDLLSLETASQRMAEMLCTHSREPTAVANAPGSGAAGGTAFGLTVGIGAQLLPGASLVAEWLRLESRISMSDIVLTGEGRFDQGSLQGKGPGTIVSRATALGRETHVFAGAIEAAVSAAAECHAITPVEMPVVDALPQTAELLREAVRRTFG